MQAAVEVDDELVLVVTTARLVFKNIATRRRIDLCRNEIRAVQRTNATVRNARNERARQRRIQRPRAQHVQRANVDVTRSNRQIVWQLTFDAKHSLHRIRRLKSVSETVNSSRHRKRDQLLGCRNQRKEIRILHRELLLRDAVQTQRLHRQVFTDAIVKDTVSTAYDSLRLLPTRLPRKTDSRGEVQIAVDVSLVLVPQTEAQRQVWTELPIVLNETAEVPLRNVSFRVTGRQTKLARTAAK